MAVIKDSGERHLTPPFEEEHSELRATVRRWVEAEGVLRRRFWKAGGGLGSAMEVDVRRVRAV